eukprot:COSAG01_NODE_1656_length_9595_cov_4.929150_11_plen_362_part_00
MIHSRCGAPPVHTAQTVWPKWDGKARLSASGATTVSIVHISSSTTTPRRLLRVVHGGGGRDEEIRGAWLSLAVHLDASVAAKSEAEQIWGLLRPAEAEGIDYRAGEESGAGELRYAGESGAAPPPPAPPFGGWSGRSSSSGRSARRPPPPPPSCNRPARRRRRRRRRSSDPAHPARALLHPAARARAAGLGGRAPPEYHLRNLILRAGMLSWLRFTYDFEIGSAELCGGAGSSRCVQIVVVVVVIVTQTSRRGRGAAAGPSGEATARRRQRRGRGRGRGEPKGGAPTNAAGTPVVVVVVVARNRGRSAGGGGAGGEHTSAARSRDHEIAACAPPPPPLPRDLVLRPPLASRPRSARSADQD